jgi:peptidoglycan/LPS O-acetylase OafA/YrhL
MIEYLKKIMAGNTSESSKRFVSVLAFFCVAILAFVATIFNKVCPEFMFDALCLISGGGLGLTVVEKIFDKQKSKN